MYVLPRWPSSPPGRLDTPLAKDTSLLARIGRASYRESSVELAQRGDIVVAQGVTTGT